MAQSPVVSVIVPVFNGERFLAQAIDSVLAQRYEPLDLIVVDDGSTDATPAIANRAGVQLRYLRQANAGPAAARNTGIAAARGELLAFLDCDDLWLPGKLARQVERFIARPELEFCVTLFQNFWESELAHEAARYRDRRYAAPLPGYWFSALVARRDLFTRVGLLNVHDFPRTCEDSDWFLRVREAGAVGELLDEVLVRRRLHGGNLTIRHRNDFPRDLLRVVKVALDRRRGTVSVSIRPAAGSAGKGPAASSKELHLTDDGQSGN
jgi:glycosyltransferase involved in cell wall biosynthesis